jgi:hypothetical protein
MTSQSLEASGDLIEKICIRSLFPDLFQFSQAVAINDVRGIVGLFTNELTFVSTAMKG